jgi:hypothetical protein
MIEADGLRMVGSESRASLLWLWGLPARGGDPDRHGEDLVEGLWLD